MRVHIGTDHAGFELKEHLREELGKLGYEVVDHGAKEYDAQDDYPQPCIAAAEGTVNTAKLGREHNNANVISIGARQHSQEEALQLVKWFLETPFSEDERHQRRINAIGAYEEQRG